MLARRRALGNTDFVFSGEGAKGLNDAGIPTTRASNGWTAVQIGCVLARTV
jgi:hypothetical protein